MPQVMMWDDHDIFDGWGSYPHALLTCSVFQGQLLLLLHVSACAIMCQYGMLPSVHFVCCFLLLLCGDWGSCSQIN